MRPRRLRTSHAIILLVLAWCTVFSPSCSPGIQQQAIRDAECATIRTFYDRAQTELIEREGCAPFGPDIANCPPHVGLREAFVASLKASECPSLDPKEMP